MPYTSSIQDNDKTILHLDIKDSDELIKSELTYGVVNEEYRKIENKVCENKSDIDKGLLSSSLADLDYKNENDIIYEYIEQIEDSNSLLDIKQLYENRLQTRLNQDNILIKKLDNLHDDDKMFNNIMNNINTKKNNKKETLEINKIENKCNKNEEKFFRLLDIFDAKWLENTDICCWWCCHKFDSIPIGFPINYLNNKFIVKGVYCSFACMIAYNKEKENNTKYKSLINLLYKKLTGNVICNKDEYIKNLLASRTYEDIDENIKNDHIKALSYLIDDKLNEAPNKTVLKMFGGKLSIEEFRNKSNEQKIYKMIEYPMYISRDYVERVDLENVKNINKRLFVDKEIVSCKNTDEKKIADAKNRLTKNEKIKELNNINRFIK